MHHAPQKRANNDFLALDSPAPAGKHQHANGMFGVSQLRVEKQYYSGCSLRDQVLIVYYTTKMNLCLLE